MKTKAILAVLVTLMAGSLFLPFPFSEAGEMAAEELQERLESGEALVVIDVREPHEHALGIIPDAHPIPGGQLADDPMIAELDRDTWIVTVCRSGNRSRVAQGILQEMGFTRVDNLVDGMLGWKGEIEIPQYQQPSWAYREIGFRAKEVITAVSAAVRRSGKQSE